MTLVIDEHLLETARKLCGARTKRETVELALREALGRDEVATVAPVVVELLSGVRKKSDCDLVREDLMGLRLLPLGWEEALLGSEIAWELARRGRRILTLDLLISAAAKRYGYEVWHFGDGHFAAAQGAGGADQRDLSR